MTFEVLVSTMNDDFSLLDKMNIDTSCIIVNQCNKDGVSIHNYKGHQVIWINSKERGLSKSRNLALSYSKAEILLLADNDEIFENDYHKLILDEFNHNKKTQLIAFNIKSIDNKRKRYLNKKRKKLSKFNIFRYGSARIAFKREFVFKHNITFNESFGAGTPMGSGEDSIFLNEFLKKHGMCMSSPIYIAKIDDSSSTWFSGFNENYFYNIGYIFYELFPCATKLYILFYLIKHRGRTNAIGFLKAYEFMKKGYNDNKKSRYENK